MALEIEEKRHGAKNIERVSNNWMEIATIALSVIAKTGKQYHRLLNAIEQVLEIKQTKEIVILPSLSDKSAESDAKAENDLLCKTRAIT